MLSESVAQNPTMPVSAGMKKAVNWPALGWPASNAEGCESIGPNPPAAPWAQAGKPSPNAMRGGAFMLRRIRIESTPLYTTHMLMAQKKMKQPNWDGVIPRAVGTPPETDGKKSPSMLWMASPPIHAWMPNHPQATKARMSAGMFAPVVPKDARQRTGNGIP